MALVISSDAALKERRQRLKQGTEEVTTMNLNPRRLEEMIKADILGLTTTSRATARRERWKWFPRLKQNVADARTLVVMVPSFLQQELRMSNEYEQNAFESIFDANIKF